MNSTRFCLLALTFASLAVGAPLRAGDEPMAAPAQPALAGQWHYFAEGEPEAREILPDPPVMGSQEQDADMATVVAVHAACSPDEAAIAFSEKKFDVFNFAAAAGPFFTEENLPKTKAFFEEVQREAAAVTDEAKELWKRPRPYVVDPTLASGKLEKSFSYPSGHSTESMVLALVLADLLPDKKEALLAHARLMGWHRIEIARHYPTDIYAGRAFALAIVRDMKASPAFQKDFAAAKAELATVRQAAKN